MTRELSGVLRRAQRAAADAPAAPAAPAAPSRELEEGVALPSMRFFGYSAREFLRITFAAAVGFLLLKWIAPKVNVPALTSAVDKL